MKILNVLLLVPLLALAPTAGAGAQTLKSGLPQPNGSVSALAWWGDTLLIGGNFTQVGGVARQNLAAIDLETGTLLDGLPAVNGPVNDLLVAHGRVYAAGKFTTAGAETRNGVFAFQMDGTLLPWNPNAGSSSDVRALWANESTVYVGGEFSVLGGTFRSNLGEVDTVLGTATSFDPNPFSVVNDIVAWGDTVIFGGNFAQVNGTARSKIAAVDRTGTLLAWNPGVSAMFYSFVWCLEATAQRLYVGGIFSTAGGQARSCLAVFNRTDLSLLSPNPSFNSYVFALAAHRDTLWSGGNFDLVSSQDRPYLARLEPASTSLMTALAAPDGSVDALAPRCNYVAAGGTFSKIGTQDLRGLAVFEYPADSVVLSAPLGLEFEAPGEDSLSLVLPQVHAGRVTWLKDGAAIAGEHADTLWAKEPGVYRAIVRTGTGCKLHSRSITLADKPDEPEPVGSGRREVPAGSWLRARNILPGEVQFTWSVPGGQAAELLVMNMQGQIVSTLPVSAQAAPHAHMYLSPGLYVCRLLGKDNSFVLTQKFWVAR
ncbi:MAG: hypothetical protein KF690_08025 [Bacteroidetes bacterium]|nr:hypothetical protein [Bacteroidota bacterium]